MALVASAAKETASEDGPAAARGQTRDQVRVMGGHASRRQLSQARTPYRPHPWQVGRQATYCTVLAAGRRWGKDPPQPACLTNYAFVIHTAREFPSAGKSVRDPLRSPLSRSSPYPHSVDE